MKTIEQIREEANIIYNNKYEYVDIDRSSKKSKIIIKCVKHGIFKKYYHDHLIRNQGCPNCSKPAKLDNSIFIQRANVVHNNTYNYSNVEYKNQNTKVSIICNNHGEFLQTPGNHLSGQKCPKCCKNIKYTLDKFIEKANEIHYNKYDYSLTQYKNINTKVKIICKEHGFFEQIPQYHLQSYGCYKCSNIVRTNEDFINKSNIVHKNLYDYSDSNYISSKELVIIKCKIHGYFNQTPNDHLNGCGCQKCSLGCFSKVAIKWLESIEQKEKINIEHAGNSGEKKIKINNKLFKLDGYCEKTNTIYEFYGDFWHGNPVIYNETDIHPLNKKMYGELYNETIDREKLLINEGYKLVTIWESDYYKKS
jgi:hypothetical protein